MQRIVVMVLVAANLLYFGWAHWAAAQRPVLTAVASTDNHGNKQSSAPPAPPPCATLGPFHDELLAIQAEKQLDKAGLHPQRRAASEDINDGWWVYVSNSSAAAQARTLEAIRGSGMRDAFAMTDDAEFRVSVGLFSDEAHAEDRATKIQHLRLDAVVKERRKQQPVIWFDMPGVAREVLGDGRLDSTGLPLDVLRVENCPAPTPENPAPPAPASPPQDAVPADHGGTADKTARSSVAALSGAGEIHNPRV